MSVEGRLAEITRGETRGSFLLWFAVLVPPMAWATQLIVNYSLEEWFACAPSTQEEGEILGLGVQTVALLITTALVLASACGLLVALRCHRRLSGGPEGEVSSRARWMALAGILNGVLYTIIIAASYGVPLLLDSCRTTP